ncbi:class I SAM-dependent methyltransferase [Cellulomonas cellasea]|uniref:Methyltransferase domain-containing protein n=1 Tax=Cellulomonas cellasea TaxID=43670 RepID=A0A4Y3KWC4_9CELL|nr:methyltransferase domain-containing protein [Cellulomonas cellasea]GEA87158.1 hypothetical protein CCE01nite_11070 [Cellulomonas cellasea]
MSDETAAGTREDARPAPAPAPAPADAPPALAQNDAPTPPAPRPTRARARTSPHRTPRRPGRAGPVPERLRWAVDGLGLRGDEQVLEVGGGPGVSAALVCARLTTGRLLAVDRSPTATRATAERNAAHVGSGRLVVLQRALADLGPTDVPDGVVDVALAVDVNVFWVADAPPEAAVLHRVLRPGAVLHVLFGAGGPTAPDRVVPRVRAALAAAGFVDLADVAAAPGFGVRARRP